MKIIAEFGDKKPEVGEAQRALQSLDFYHLLIDDIYGPGMQMGLNKFQEQNGLPVTGVLDELTFKRIMESEKTVNKKLDLSPDKIKDIFKEKGYFLNESNYIINIIGIRMDNIYDNLFTDKCIIMWINEYNKWETHLIDSWTTMPGTLGKGGAFNPFNGRLGIIKPGQYQKVWRFIDSYSLWLRYPFFHQVGKFQIYRDADKDHVMEYSNPVEDSYHQGFNCHRMTNNGVISKQLNFAWATWSAGCQGAPEPIFKKLVELARITTKVQGHSIFPYTLLEQKDFM